MAGLQRSAISFRRTGSSGLVWDDRFFSGQLPKPNPNPNNLNNPTPIKSNKLRFYSGELTRGSRGLCRLDVSNKDVSLLDQQSFELKPIKTVRRKEGDDGRGEEEVEEMQPPSPKVSGCGCCVGIAKKTAKPKSMAKGKGKEKAKAKATREVRSEPAKGVTWPALM